MILESVWFFLWGLLWAIYFMTDGFDLGLGTLMPFLAKSENDKKVIVKTFANKTFGDFIQQRKRWASKGLFYNNKSLVFKLILIYSFYAGLIAQLIIGLTIDRLFILTLLISIFLKFIFEFRILLQGKRKLFDDLKLKYLFLAEFIQILYIIYAGLVGAFGNYLWKERKVKR